MGPNKIEKQFREKLNTREIQPSAQAWDRLDAMLSVAEEKKTKRPLGWLYIAAGILVLLTVGMFLFNQKNANMEPQNNVVGTEIKKDTVENSIKSNPTSILKKEVQTQAVASSEKQPTTNQFQSSPEAQPNSLERSGKNQKATVNQKTSINQNQIINEKVIQNPKQEAIVQNEQLKVDDKKEIAIKKDINVKSDEGLLADLDKTSKQTSNQKTNVKVDAKSLLSQVDGEVEYTFREKVLNRMNKNYKEIKVALANRNKE
jgi:hypothetical protein